MKRDFNTLTIDDIDTQFLQKYVNHLNGRNVDNKLQKLRRVFREANADTSVFGGVKIPVKLEDEPLSVDHTAIERIEFMNRDKLTDKEELYIDLFLFGYYTGGSTVNEMASFKISSIKKGYLYCKRNASENIAIIPLCTEALYIIDKYQSMRFDDYLLPIFTHKHNSPKQQLGRIKRISELTNQTLRKVSKMLKLENVIMVGMAKSKPYSVILKKYVKIMVNNIHQIRTNCAGFTFLIKVSNLSKTTLFSVYLKKRGCLKTQTHPLFFILTEE